MWKCGVKTLIVLVQILRTFGQNLEKDSTLSIRQLETTSQLPKSNANTNPYAFENSVHGLHSDLIFALDDRTIFIPKFYYDGLKPDAFFWVGNGSLPTSNGLAALNGPLKAFKGQNVAIILPNNLTVYSIDYLSVWCPSRNKSFGHVQIPRGHHGRQIPQNEEEKENKTVISLHKCCDMNEVLGSSGCTPSNQQFSPDVSVHLHNETHIDDEPIPAQSIVFQPIIEQIKCSGRKYPLTEEDDYVLLQNGTLIVLRTQKLLPPGNYCFETINFGDEAESSWLTTPIVCFTDEIPKASTVFYIYASGILLSAVLLIATAVIFLWIKEIRDTRGKCVIGYSITMAAAFILLAFAQFSGIENTTCTVFGFIIQFFLVQSFVWVTILSWETFYKIKNYNNGRYGKDKVRFKIYCAIGFAVPILTSLLSFIIDRVPGIPNTFLKPKFGRNECWFDQSTKTMVYFYIPIAIAITINIVLNILMKCYLVRFERNATISDVAWRTTKIDLKPMFRSCVFLLIVMTLCWVMEVITFSIKDLGSFGIAMDFIDSLQGAFIFAIFILHRPVKDQLKKLKDKKYFRKLKQRETPKVDAEYVNGATDCADHKLFLKNMRRTESTEDLS